MALFYPHKQTMLIALVCFIVVGAAAYYAYGSSFSNQTDAAAVSVSTASPSDAAPQQALPETDWQKQFLSGPIASSPATTSVQSGSGAPKTDTDKLGQDIFARYIALKQANLLDNADVVNQAAEDSVVSNFDSIQPKTYALSDLNVTQSTDSATISAYTAGIAKAIETFSAPQGEGAIVESYLSTNDPSALAALDPIVASYKRMLSMLLALRTPTVAESDQLDLVNAVSALEFAAESMRNADSDNVRGLAGASLHVQGINLMLQALGDINNDVSDYGGSLKLDPGVFNTMLN